MEDYRKFDRFCRQLKQNKKARMAIRPGKPNNGEFLIPLDQISRKHDFILSKGTQERDVIANSSLLSFDNNHKPSPEKLYDKEWMWVGGALCLRKFEELRQRMAKMIFDKICTCKGTGRNCTLKNLKGIYTDFETGF